MARSHTAKTKDVWLLNNETSFEENSSSAADINISRCYSYASIDDINISRCYSYESLDYINVFRCYS